MSGSQSSTRKLESMKPLIELLAFTFSGLLFISSLQAQATKTEELTLATGRVYKNVRLTDIEPNRIRIFHEGGVAWLFIDDIPVEFQLKIGVDIPEDEQLRNKFLLEMRKYRALSDAWKKSYLIIAAEAATIPNKNDVIYKNWAILKVFDEEAGWFSKLIKASDDESIAIRCSYAKDVVVGSNLSGYIDSFLTQALPLEVPKEAEGWGKASPKFYFDISQKGICAELNKDLGNEITISNHTDFMGVRLRRYEPKIKLLIERNNFAYRLPWFAAELLEPSQRAKEGLR